MLRRLPVFTLFPYTTLFRSPLGFLGGGGFGLVGVDEDLAAIGLNLVARAAVQYVLLGDAALPHGADRKSTRLNSSHGYISYAVFFFKKKIKCCVQTVQGVGY